MSSLQNLARLPLPRNQALITLAGEQLSAEEESSHFSDIIMHSVLPAAKVGLFTKREESQRSLSSSQRRARNRNDNHNILLRLMGFSEKKPRGPNKIVEMTEEVDFAMFEVQVHSAFSATRLHKSFSDFSQLHKKLVALSQQTFVEIRNPSSGKLESVQPLSKYLPSLPKTGRSLWDSFFRSSTSQNKDDLHNRQKMARIKQELSAYAQQLLLLFHLFFVHARFLAKKRKFLKALEQSLTKDIYRALLNQPLDKQPTPAREEESSHDEVPNEREVKAEDEVSIEAEQEEMVEPVGAPETNVSAESHSVDEPGNESEPEGALNRSIEKQDELSDSQVIGEFEEMNEKQQIGLEREPQVTFSPPIHIPRREHVVTDSSLQLLRLRAHYVRKFKEQVEYIPGQWLASDLWAKEIASFFEIEASLEKEQKAARTIQRFHRNSRKVLLAKKFKLMVRSLKAEPTHILHLPSHVFSLVCSFFNQTEAQGLQRACSHWRQIISRPHQRLELRIQNNQKVFELHEHRIQLRRFVQRSSMLRIISLKYLPFLNKDVIDLLNNNCNPFALRELYLDGCENLSDEAFDCIGLSSGEQEQEAPKFSAEFIEQQKAILDFFQKQVEQRNDSMAQNVSLNPPTEESSGVVSSINNSLEAPRINPYQEWLKSQFLTQENIDIFLSDQPEAVLAFFHNAPGGQVGKDNKIFSHVAGGGLRGLRVLSLAECRNFSDSGIEKLKELKFLTKLNLLGCQKIEDKGLRLISTQFAYIEDLDLGGSTITAAGLRDLANSSAQLKTVSIMGCKKLNNSDDQILVRAGIRCLGVDDVFRFHLHPELTSHDLPQITKSVLKTRSTLGLNKVYKYLFKRLIQQKVDDLLLREADSFYENPETIVPEERIELYCRGHYLKPTLQLRDVKELHWKQPFEQNQSSELLILHYKKKLSKQESEAVDIDRRYQRKRETMQDMILQQPNLAVPEHLSLVCGRCPKKLDQTLVENRVNCMKCGGCFCKNCCRNEEADQRFGFRLLIRVCDGCKSAE